MLDLMYHGHCYQTAVIKTDAKGFFTLRHSVIQPSLNNPMIRDATSALRLAGGDNGIMPRSVSLSDWAGSGGNSWASDREADEGSLLMRLWRGRGWAFEWRGWKIRKARLSYELCRKSAGNTHHYLFQLWSKTERAAYLDCILNVQKDREQWYSAF